METSEIELFREGSLFDMAMCLISLSSTPDISLGEWSVKHIHICNAVIDITVALLKADKVVPTWRYKNER